MPPAQSLLLETLFIAGGWKRVLFSFFLYFCLDAKEPKDQDTAKLPPHMPDAGPLLCRPTAPTKQAIVVNGISECFYAP